MNENAISSNQWKRRVTIFTCGVLLLGATALYYSCRSPHPFAQGKPAGYWTKEFKMGTQRREKAELAFREMGSNAVPYLIVALNKKETSFSKNYEAFGRKLPERVQEFLEIPKESPELLRARAAGVIADIATPASPESVAALRIALTDPYFGVRNNAVVALGKTAPNTSASREAVAALMYATGDTNLYTRGNAYNFLGSFAPSAVEAIPILQFGLQDPEIFVRLNAGTALRKFQIDPNTIGKVHSGKVH